MLESDFPPTSHMLSPLSRFAVTAGLMLMVRAEVSGRVAEAFAPAEAKLIQGTPSAPMGEYRLKASYVSLLPDYITWPASSRQDGHQLVIGIVGESPFGNHLNDLFLPGKPQSTKSRLVYITNNLRAIENCDVLFICESESERLYEILRKIKGRPVLTLADSPDFARRGVMINLFLDRDRIGFEVNLPALRSSGLEMSPHILKNAKIIE